jgi:hypothetical protein
MNVRAQRVGTASAVVTFAMDIPLDTRALDAKTLDAAS